MENTTNVEMSLSTIEKLVASAVQKALTEYCSDEFIGQAAQRYQQKMAVVNGGAL
ncbi:MAG: hypothetical protein IJA74_01855 [Oscillospiraceae bacterium]|nr:hypothetical protein [Oscillospiraceae bacterium]